MEITRTTVPGKAEVHHLLTRRGARLAVITERDGEKQLLVFDAAQGESAEVDSPDEPSHTLPLEPDEADQLAQILHSTTISDRVARLERRIHQLASEGSR